MEFIELDETIRTKLKGKNVLIYDLTILTKSALVWLMEFGVYVYGFLLPDDKRHLAGIEYLNKPMFFPDDIQLDIDKYAIIDIFGDSMDIISSKMNCKVYVLGKRTNIVKDCDVIIYGAGINGENLYYVLDSMGIHVSKFCDSDPAKWAGRCCGKEIISPDTLKQDYFNATVILGLREAIAEQVGMELCKKGFISKYYTFGNSITPYHISIKSKSSETVLSFSPLTIHYQIKSIMEQGKELVFWGNRENIGSIAEKLRFFDIVITSAIDYAGFIGIERGINYFSAYDLLYMDCSKIVLWVLDEARTQAVDMLIDMGVEKKIACCCGFQQIDIFWQVCLDPNLGYSVTSHDAESPFILSNKPVSRSRNIKLGIVGGSTSDSELYIETSWPEYLLQIADNRGIDLVIYNGAAGGYAASQELIKFLRDMINLHLDVLISYSGFNEYLSNYFKNFFIHKYQADLFHRCARFQDRGTANIRSNDVVSFGIGVNDYTRHWIQQERMMYAVCQEYGINFYAIFQPTLYTKDRLSTDDYEIMEHMISPTLHEGEFSSLMHIREAIRNTEYSWVTDFSHLFDEYDEGIYWDSAHLTSYGNRILAEAVFELIQDNLMK